MKIKREVKIGLFAVAMLLCLYLGINYLKGKDVFSNDKTYYALYEQTSGLQKASPVLLRGVKIGSVTGIRIDYAKTDKVVVTVNIKRNIKIPTDSRLNLFSDGLMGGKAIELVPGTSTSYFERNAIIPSESENGLLEYASVSIEDVINELKKVANSINTTAITINTVLEQNAESFKGTMDNLNSTTRQIADAKVGVMLDDLGSFTSVLKNNSSRFDSIVGNLNEVSGSLAQVDIKSTVNGLNSSIEHINDILAKLSKGEGTGGKLLEDPALYDSLTLAAGNLVTLLEDLKENPKRYVHFSLFGGGNKDKDKDKKRDKNK